MALVALARKKAAARSQRARRRSGLGAPVVVVKQPDVGMGISYRVRLGRGAIARIELERRGPTRSFIHWVYVPPTHRGCGLGDILIRRVLRDADRHGVTLGLIAKACASLDQAGLERWYERLGFVRGRQCRLGRFMTRAPRRVVAPRQVA